MQYSDEELMLLEQLTYMDENVCKAAGVDPNKVFKAESVEEMLSYFDDDALYKLDEVQGQTICDAKGNSTYIQGNEWAAVLREIKNNDDLMDLQIHDKEFYGKGASKKIDNMVFFDEDSPDDAIVCFRGTLGPEEWADNFKLLLTGETPINKDVLKYVNDLPFENLTTVGHSKGANKAAYTYYLSDKVGYCVAMDCPGFPASFYEEHPEAIQKVELEGGIYAYAVSNDFVNIVMNTLVANQNYYCVGYGQHGVFENHSPNTFFHFLFSPSDPTTLYHDENGSLLEFTEQSEHMAKLHGFTLFVYKFMPQETKEEMAEFLGNTVILAMGGEITVDGVKYTKDTMMDYLMTDTEMFSTLIAYLMAYATQYDLDWEDLKEFIPFFSLTRLAAWRLFANAKESFEDGELNDDFWFWWDKVVDTLEIDPKVGEQIWNDALEKYNDIIKMDGMGQALVDVSISDNSSSGTTETASGSNVRLINQNGRGGTTDNNVTDVSSTTTRTQTESVALNQDPSFIKDENTLYIDNAVYNTKRKNIFNAANNLIFDDSVLEKENEVCGTETMYLCTNYWREVLGVTEEFKSFKMGPSDTIMKVMAQSINDVDAECSTKINVEGDN